MYEGSTSIMYASFGSHDPASLLVKEWMLKVITYTTGFHPDIFTRGGRGGVNYSFGNLKGGSVTCLVVEAWPREIMKKSSCILSPICHVHYYMYIIVFFF